MLGGQGHEVAVLAAAETLPNGACDLVVSNPEAYLDRRSMGYPVFRAPSVCEAIPVVKRTFDPTVAVVQSGLAFQVARSCLENNVKTIVYLRDTEYNKLGGDPPTSCLVAYLANSQYVAEAYRQQFGISAFVIPPLVKPERYRTSTIREVVLFVNPTRLKGLDRAIDLVQARRDIPFLFLESWTLSTKAFARLQDFQRRLPNLTLKKRVMDMRPIYRLAHILLVPSIWDEAWARVVTEAQVNGIPVLARHVGGLPESVGSGGVLLDRAVGPCGWLNALSKVWDYPAEYDHLSRAAFEHSMRPEVQPGLLLRRFLEFVYSRINS